MENTLTYKLTEDYCGFKGERLSDLLRKWLKEENKTNAIVLFMDFLSPQIVIDVGFAKDKKEVELIKELTKNFFEKFNIKA